MDPNATIAEMSAISTQDEMTEDDAERLADLWVSLDGWMRNGGFLPTAWAAGR